MNSSKSTKVIDALIEDTVDTMYNHYTNAEWMKDRIYQIIEMAEDVKRIWMVEEVMMAFGDSSMPKNESTSVEDLIIERLSKPIFKVKK